ncbi:MAG: hypothetical protein ACLFNW_04795 [Desulfobacterales bacterium]
MKTPNDTERSALESLSKIYRLYDDYINSFSIACRKYCADCCTTAVIMTSLEGRMIYNFLEPEKRRAFFEKHIAVQNKNKFQPAMTTNQYARLCSQHKEPPEEQYPEEPDKCPLLEKDACSIYPVRPFGCRCMISEQPCRRTGSASMDDFTLTVNTMFLQIIEHLDQHGFSGNLVDVLLRLEAEDGDSPTNCPTVPNQPISILMIPPEHQRKVSPLLTTLNHILKTHQGRP